MMKTEPVDFHSFGKSIEDRFIHELDAKPNAAYTKLLDLKNLKGESTGYVKAMTADRLIKASSLSINMMPGGRYFNIHIIPEPQYNVPRFVFEGMLTAHGSQVSMDLFPDIDVVMQIRKLRDQYEGVAKIYDDVRKDEKFQLEPSRQIHMRAFTSPFFILIFGVPEIDLPAIEDYAHAYFDEWLTMHRSAETVSPEEAELRARRRLHIAQTTIESDPDRHLVVKVYGEETTRDIEQATMN